MEKDSVDSREKQLELSINNANSSKPVLPAFSKQRNNKPVRRKQSATKNKKPMRNKQLGKRGEEAAANYLMHCGYEILEMNWKCFAGEADIIAHDGKTLVFVEVKTRSDSSKGFPSEAVTEKKRAKYEKIALAYLANYEFSDIPVRFDVLSIVTIAPQRAMLKHHIAAFSVAS